jgi:hypothetical protein
MNEIPILYLLVILDAYALVAGALPALVLGFLYEFSDGIEADLTQRLELVRVRLAEDKTAISGLLKQSLPFRGQAEPPFAAPVQRYNRTVDAALALVDRIQHNRRRLRQGLPGKKSPGLGPLQRARLGTGWGLGWVQGLALQLETNDLDRLGRRAARDFDQVLEVKSRVARDVQKVFALKNAVDQLLADLQQMQLRGGLFAQALEESQTLQRISGQIPEKFYTTPVPLPVTAAEVDVGQVTDVYRRAGALRSDYNRLFQQLKGWAALLADFRKAQAEAQQALVLLYTTHSSVPRNMDIHELVAQIFEANRRARRLAEFAGRPELEAVGQARQEYLALKRDALAQQRVLKQVIRLYNDWGSAVEQASVVMDRLKNAMDGQEAGQSVYPLQWGQTRATYEQLSGLLSAIQGHAYKIRVEQIQADIAACKQLKRPVEALVAHCARKAAARLKLLGLWAELESVFDPAWKGGLARLDAETRRFAAENWDAALAVRAFLADGSGLVQAARQLVPAEKTTPLPEENLDEWVIFSQQELRQMAVYQARVVRIQAGLEAAWDAERQAARILSLILPELDAVLALFDRLRQAATTLDDLDHQVRQGITQTKEHGAALGGELNQRMAGQVFAKRRDIETWARGAVQHCEALVQATGQEIAQQEEDLSDRLAELGRIALLAGDPLVQFATQAVNAADQLYVQQGAINLADAEGIHLRMEAAGKQIETNLMQRAVLKRLNQEVEGLLQTIRDRWQEVQNILVEVYAGYQRALALDHGEQWPPTFINMERVNGRLLLLRQRYAEVVQTSTRATMKIQYEELRRECQRALRELWDDVRAAEVQEQTVQAIGERVQALLQHKRTAFARLSGSAESSEQVHPAILSRWEAINGRWEWLAGGAFRGMAYNDLLRVLSELEILAGALPE